MRVVWSVLVLVAAGCDKPRESLSKPRAVVDTRGTVQEGIFSADGQAFLGWVVPAGKDPAAERLKPKPWVLWSAADGSEVARWTGDPTPGFDAPGSSDGTTWPVHLHLPAPPKFTSRCRLLDLTTGAARDVPGVTGPAESCTRPSYSADRTRLAYSDYAKDADRRTGRVYEKAAAGWTRVAEVAGEKATLSPDGQFVATVGRKPDNSRKLFVRLYAVADGTERWAAPVDSYGLRGFTPDGRYVVQTDNAGHRLFDAKTGRQAVLVANGPRTDSKGPDEVAYRAGWVAAVVRTGQSAELVRWDVAAGKEASRATIDAPHGRNGTPPFGSPWLPVVRPTQQHPAPNRPNARRSSTAVEVYDPAAADPVVWLALGNPVAVIASPDGGTLAAVGYGSLAFHPLPATK